MHSTKAEQKNPMAAYFAFEQAAPDGETKFFIFKLVEPSKIDEARAILQGTHPEKRSVQGTIVKARAPYNPEWSFHLAPMSIGFFEIQTEVCDANATYVEQHLDEVGGSTLPGNFWCPWSSRLAREVTDRIDPNTERPVLPFGSTR
jgi:hypothetical protein